MISDGSRFSLRLLPRLGVRARRELGCYRRETRGTDPNGGVEAVGLQERTSRAAVKRRHTATFPLRIRFCLVLTFIYAVRLVN